MKLDQYLKARGISQAEFGRLLSVPVTAGMVGHWVAGRHPITAERAKQIEFATGGAVTRHELRPDIFDAPAAAVTAESVAS